MNDVIIKFEGNDVIIRGPKEILKISIDPTVGGIQKITEPAEPITKRQTVKKHKVVKNTAKPKGKITRTKITKEIIDQIIYLRDDEKMTSKQIAEELGISLSAVNKHYRPLSSEREIN